MDLGFLTEGTGNGVLQLGSPMAIEQKQMALSNLARQGQLDDLKLDSVRRDNATSDAYNKAIGPIIQSGFDPKVVASVLQQYPQAAPLVQKAWDDHVSRQDKIRTSDTNEFDKKTEKLLTQYSQMAGGLASAIKKDPNSVPDAMIANFYGKVADNGLAKYMPTLPFKDWSDKAAVARHLETLGDAFYTTNDRVKNVETAAKNKDDSARNWKNVDSEVANREGMLGVARGNLGVAQANLKLNQDKAAREGTQRDPAVVKIEMQLADDYRTNTKGFQETARSLGIVKSALKTATTNPGSALVAGTSFMKLLDPTSVVRESELGMALNASGWFDRATVIAQQMKSGKIMTATQQANLGAAAEALWKEAAAAQRKIDMSYASRAKKYGADPSNIIVDLGQNSVADDAAPKQALGMGPSAGPNVMSNILAPAPQGSGAQWVYKPGAR